jgi:hypothetical protein
MILEFKDGGAGFRLESPELDKYDEQDLSEEYTGEFGDNVWTNEDGEIVHYDYAFRHDSDTLDFEIKEIDKYKVEGLYTVPQLNLRDVIFKEVLKAVRRYYLQKLSSHKQRTATV